MIPMNTQIELMNFQNKIQNQRRNDEDHFQNIVTETFLATVKQVNSDGLTVDVFVAKLNAEVKNVQVLMPTMSPSAGRLALPQVNTAVVIVFASYMRPFILASVPFLDEKIPQIYKNESVEYTNNTFAKHTLEGSIVNSAGNKNTSILKSDGGNVEYNSDKSRYSSDGFEINANNDELGNIEFKKTYIKYDKEMEDVGTLNKLRNLKSKLETHKQALENFKSDITQKGFDKESVSNSVSQLRSLLYNEYKSGEYYIKTQKGFVLKKQIENLTDIKNAKKDDIKHSVHGSRLIFETECVTKNGEVLVSIDEDRNVDISCNKFTINGRGVFNYD